MALNFYDPSTFDYLFCKAVSHTKADGVDLENCPFALLYFILLVGLMFAVKAFFFLDP